MERLRCAAADVFTRPALYWTIAVLFGLQRLLFTVVAPRRYDAEGMWEGAHAYLTNPSHMYDAAADYLARVHIIAPPGGLDAFVSPPPVALLAVPVALLPRSVGAQVWTAIDAAALLLALVLLYRVLASKDRLARPIFWVAAVYFPPLFADVSAGQRGGVLLALAMASVWFERSRPALAGALGGFASAIKYYPAAMIIGPRPQHRIRYAVLLPARPSAFARLAQSGLRVRLGAHAVHAHHRWRTLRGSVEHRIRDRHVAAALCGRRARPVLPERAALCGARRVGRLAQWLESGLRHGAGIRSRGADPQRGMAVPVAASAAGRSDPAGARGRTEADGHDRAAWSLPGRLLAPAMRPVLPEPLDHRRDRNLRFGRVGELAFSVGRNGGESAGRSAMTSD